jgi:transcriptional regulator with XRE-family HTH domain
MARKTQPATISEQLRKAILASELSQAEIARRSGVPREVLSRFTRGLTGMSLASLDAVSVVLGLRLVGPEEHRH